MQEELFVRFPSFQKAGAGAYKPGIDNMLFFDQLAGHPHKNYRCIHIAGTNGKGSVSNMLASALAACGMKVGLYTSPHILDFRERMRIIDGDGSGCCAELIAEEEVWRFVQQWKETFDHLDLSFFEITTMMAFDWFAARKVDVAVIETGLGGRLDSTNIITPVLSLVTNIGMDHCDLLGESPAEIAFEKAGIIKPLVPVVVGESHPETDAVFERKVLYTNLSEAEYMGDRARIMRLLTFADKLEPPLWDRHEEILEAMDLKGEYQRKNLRTILAALEILLPSHSEEHCESRRSLIGAITHTASRTGFRGRWEKISDTPYTICDIGHNSHGLKYNFAQLEKMMQSGEFDRLTIVYAAMADKDVEQIVRMFPPQAELLFVTVDNKRAMPAQDILKLYLAAGGDASRARTADSPADAEQILNQVQDDSVCHSEKHCDGESRHLVYIGGSTYLVSALLNSKSVILNLIQDPPAQYKRK